VLLISSQVPAASGSTALGAAAFGSVARLQSAVGGVVGGLHGFWAHYIALGGASRDNEALRAHVLDLEGQLEAERARTARVDALEDALNLARSVASPTLAARIIAGNPVTGVLTVNVDRGTADGVHPNMAVINGKGVVGRVIGNPAKHAATVQLIIDRTAAAGALLEKSGSAGGVTGGFSDGNLRFGLISSATPVAVGERVLTSGQDGIFPKGFLIGQVVQIKGEGKAREVVVAPAVSFDRVDIVLILLTRPGPGQPQP
jgi:rod shape-determining protein MreC